MHLTPEQIDRQPFRMTRRGYDIVEVRNFLREIASEMRARQEVRERLAETGGDTSVAEDRAHRIIADAQTEADQILADAEATAGSVEAMIVAESRASEIVGSAEGVAVQMVEDAEQAARARSGEVLAATQARLDQLLEEERSLHARVEKLRAEADVPEVVDDVQDARDLVAIPSAPDSSIAELLKSTLRDETYFDDAV